MLNQVGATDVRNLQSPVIVRKQFQDLIIWLIAPQSKKILIEL